MTAVTAAAITAAQQADYATRPPHSQWHRVDDDQVARLLEGAEPHLAAERFARIAERPSAVKAIAGILHGALCGGDCGMVTGFTGQPVTGCVGMPSDDEHDTAEVVFNALDEFLAPYVTELATARDRIAELETRVDELGTLVGDILGQFTRNSDGYRARVGQVQIGKWRKQLAGQQ